MTHWTKFLVGEDEVMLVFETAELSAVFHDYMFAEYGLLLPDFSDGREYETVCSILRSESH